MVTRVSAHHTPDGTVIVFDDPRIVISPMHPARENTPLSRYKHLRVADDVVEVRSTDGTAFQSHHTSTEDWLFRKVMVIVAAQYRAFNRVPLGDEVAVYGYTEREGALADAIYRWSMPVLAVDLPTSDAGVAPYCWPAHFSVYPSADGLGYAEAGYQTHGRLYLADGNPMPATAWIHGTRYNLP